MVWVLYPDLTWDLQWRDQSQDLKQDHLDLLELQDLVLHLLLMVGSLVVLLLLLRPSVMVPCHQSVVTDLHHHLTMVLQSLTMEVEEVPRLPSTLVQHLSLSMVPSNLP